MFWTLISTPIDIVSPGSSINPELASTSSSNPMNILSALSGLAIRTIDDVDTPRSNILSGSAASSRTCLPYVPEVAGNSLDAVSTLPPTILRQALV